MAEEQELITVTSHLTKTEVGRIKAILNSAKIKFIVSGHDAASRYSSLDYQVRVKPEDFKSAKKMIDKEKGKYLLKAGNAQTVNTWDTVKLEKEDCGRKLSMWGQRWFNVKSVNINLEFDLTLERLNRVREYGIIIQEQKNKRKQ
jgi:hypothetical protein